MKLRPFFSFFGGKWRAAPRYPSPKHTMVVEPFAGSAGYATRHHDRQVLLVERDPVIAELWRFLIGTTPAEVRRIPCVEATADLPGWVPAGARSLVGFWLNSGREHPSRSLSSGNKVLYARQDSKRSRFAGWTKEVRARVASQVGEVCHWRVLEGDYSRVGNFDATWFVDAPYVGGRGMGHRYVHGPRGIDYAQLAVWCRARRGQVIVCEAEGADWLPFEPFGELKAGPAHGTSREVIWVGGS